MLYLNVSQTAMSHWGRTIDLYYSIHLAGFLEDLKSVNFSIEEIDVHPGAFQSGGGTLFQCVLQVIPKSGNKIGVIVEMEDCGAAIEQCFAKAKRSLLRRARGFAEVLANPSYGSNVDQERLPS